MKDKILKHFKIIFPLVFLLAITGMSFLLYHTYNEALSLIKEQFNNQQILLAKQTAVAIEENIKLLVRELKEFSQEPPIKNLNLKDSREIIRKKFDHIKGLYVNDVGLLDPKGIIRFSLRAPHFEGAYFLYRQYFKKARALTTSTAVLGTITFKEADREKKGIIIAMPIFSRDGEFSGVGFFTLTVNELIKNYVPLESTDSKAYIIDSFGYILGDPRDLQYETIDNIQNTDVSYRTFLEEAKAGKIVTGEYLSPEGIKTIAVSYPLRLADQTWSMIIATPEEVLSKLLKRISIEYIITTLVALLVVASTSVIIIYLINRWSLELDSMVKTRTKELQKYAVELEKARNNLECKVEERTRELKKAHETLVRKEKLAVLGELAGSVSHELRNPLGVIKNAIYFFNMRMNTFEDEEIKENIKIITREINTANKIISDLLDFTRDKVPVRLEANLNQLVKEMLSKSLIPNNIKVITELTEQMVTISIDPTQVAQVFLNLIENALQAMGEGGTLKVSSRVTDNSVEVSFADEGCGISKGNLGRIFDPLFTTKAKGIGLGLAISKSLAEANRGAIMVESDGRKGSTFTVRFTKGN